VVARGAGDRHSLVALEAPLKRAGPEPGTDHQPARRASRTSRSADRGYDVDPRDGTILVSGRELRLKAFGAYVRPAAGDVVILGATE